MRIFNLDPLGFILAFHDADFVVGSASLTLSQNADINLAGRLYMSILRYRWS